MSSELPTEKQKNKNKTLKIVLGVVAGLVLLGISCCVGTVILGSVLPPVEVVSTLVPTKTEITKCVAEISSDSNSIYIIIEGFKNDSLCDAFIEEMQTKDVPIHRVYSYPVSPIICSKQYDYDGGVEIFVIDTSKSGLFGKAFCSGLNQ